MNSVHDAIAQRTTTEGTVVGILVSIGFCHLLNDMLRSLIPAVYPLLKSVGRIATATPDRPLHGPPAKPYSLTIGMRFTLVGLVLFSMASGFVPLLCAAATVGLGSAVFHPESSRVARMASGGQHGLAQSVFQVGGNAGSGMGPLLAALALDARCEIGGR